MESSNYITIFIASSMREACLSSALMERRCCAISTNNTDGREQELPATAFLFPKPLVHLSNTLPEHLRHHHHS